MRRAGVGRLTHQYNPQGGAKSVGQWLTAVTSMKGENGAMSVPDAVAMIRATSPAKRSEYAEEIWKTRKARGNPMSFSVKDVEYDSGVNKTYGVVVTPVFTDRYSVSGRASAREFKDLVAYTVEKRMARDNPKRRNPEEEETESADSYEKFHGFRPKERITVKKKIRYHENLWACGDLEKLDVISPDGVQVMIDGFKGAMLSANEANTQLYIEGGDQSVNLADFGLGEPYHDKEDLGEIEKLYYFTNKTHLGDQGGEAIYHHTLGEERTKRDYLFGKLKGRKVPRPRLVYDVMNQALEIIGGEYVIEPEGIRN